MWFGSLWLLDEGWNLGGHRWQLGFPGGASGKESACWCWRLERPRFDPWVRKTPWRRAWQPSPVFLLNNSMDRGVWQAVVHRVAKSRTWMKPLCGEVAVTLEKEMVTHSSVPAWRTPGTAEPGGLPSMGSHRVRHDWSDLAQQQQQQQLPMPETRVRSLGREDPLEKEMATHSSILAWKIPRTEDTVRLPSVGSQRVGHDWATSLHFSSYKGC